MDKSEERRHDHFFRKDRLFLTFIIFVPMNVLQAESLSKMYRNLTVVNNLSLEVKEGEIYGFIGLNGAGKTTTIRMLLDMVRPSNGSVTLFGRKLKSGDQLLNKVGYLVETPYSYPDLTVIENLEIFLSYRKLKDKNIIESIVQTIHLDAYRDVKAKHLSMGNKQRLGLAKALFHQPRLLILDEPTNGLDPAGIVEIRSLLKEMSSAGATIFISSHLLGEVSKLATRIGIIHEGKLMNEVLTADLENDLRRSMIISTNDNARSLALLNSLGYSFTFRGDKYIQSNDTGCLTSNHVIAEQLVKSGVGLQELYIEKEDLELYFLRQIAQ